MRYACVALLFALASAFAAAANPPLLLQTPTLSSTQMAFAYGDEIWIAPRSGGDARLLVGGDGLASDPVFSPDGQMLAYTGDYDGIESVYVVPAAGGEPRRLSWHPGKNEVVGWTPDGHSVLFVSHRNSNTDSDHLFTVPMSGGLPSQLPLSMAESGSYSPDGSQLAYSPAFQWEPDWKGYRGGQTTPIWIARLADSSVVKIPRDNSNDRDPMWVGDSVYFLSDRDGPVTLFAYDTKTGSVTKLLNNDGFDIDSASAGPGGIVYSTDGSAVSVQSCYTCGHAARRARGRRHAAVAAAFCESGQGNSERRYLAQWRARGVRGPRRDPDGAGGQGRHPRYHARRPAPPSATRPGRRMASRWRISPTPPVNTRCTSVIRTD